MFQLHRDILTRHSGWFREKLPPLNEVIGKETRRTKDCKANHRLLLGWITSRDAFAPCYRGSAALPFLHVYQECASRPVLSVF